MRSDIEPLRKVIRSVIGEELSVLQAPQTITALSLINVVRDDLRQVIWEPEREQQPIRRIPTYSEVLRQPALHSNVAVAMAAATRGHQVVHLVHRTNGYLPVLQRVVMLERRPRNSDIWRDHERGLCVFTEEKRVICIGAVLTDRLY